MKQFWLAVDQLLNTMVYSSSENKFGYADELLSARMWRLNDRSPRWKFAQEITDRFFLVLFNEEDHCYNAWTSELMRDQLPKPYQEFLYHYERNLHLVNALKYLERNQ
jgi:hypothetical protein